MEIIPFTVREVVLLGLVFITMGLLWYTIYKFEQLKKIVNLKRSRS